MTDDRPERVTLLEQSEALRLYLASLFREPAPTPVPTSPGPAAAPAAARCVPPVVATEVRPLVPVTTSEPMVPPVVTEEEPRADETLPTLEELAAQGPFASLLMRVGGVRLAIPLKSLYGIRRHSERLARLPDSPSWVLGLLHDRQERVQVVDTRFLLRRSADGMPGQAAPADYSVLIVAKGRWGLNCEQIEHVITVQPAAVKWRAERRKRPWFAGVLPGELCTLVDVPALVAWLDAGLVIGDW